MIPNAFRQKGGGTQLGVRPHSQLPGPFGPATREHQNLAPTASTQPRRGKRTEPPLDDSELTEDEQHEIVIDPTVDIGPSPRRSSMISTTSSTPSTKWK